MYPRSFQRSSLQHYQDISLSSRIEAASPHALVAILYEELVGALDVVRAGVERGQAAAIEHASLRASSILVALETGLDMDKGGALATRLAGIYKTMRVQLAAAARDRDVDKLAELRNGAGDLLTTWIRIGR